jgi:myosin heavy subunit
MEEVRVERERISLFVKDEIHVWLAATLERSDEDTEGSNAPSITVLVEDHCNGRVIREERVLKGVDVSNLPLQNLDVPSGGVDNMTNLGYLHEASILHNLKRRFTSYQPYTRTGQIVIAINPYKWLDIYGKDKMKEYASKLWHELPSHAFATSAEAYRGLRERGKQQSILVSGESGAGKTETVKIMLNMVATVASETGACSDGGNSPLSAEAKTVAGKSVVEKILLANPLLESFGNAKTTRNDNSSRFGKFMTLQFDGKSALVGSNCSTYLLEKSRVVVQNDPMERNYHIFYQLLSASEDAKQRLLLQNRHADSFLYTMNGDVTRDNSIEGVRDAVKYSETLKVLSVLNVNSPLQSLMEEVLAGILHLGEVLFATHEEEEGASVASNAVECSSLLGVPEDAFREQIVRRNIEVEGKTIKVGLTPEQSASTRDALAKEVYARLFQWLVIVINHTTSTTAAISPATGEPSTISLLDIFGFESFTINRFEQLCINLANEKLQQKFCTDCFHSVQQEYQDEGLEWTKIGFQDNADTLLLLEGSRSVLAALNEECLLGKRGTDAGFLSKTKSFCGGAEQFSMVLTRRNAFRITHYAGTVEYCVEGFLDKNRDSYPQEMQAILAGSTNALVASFFGPHGSYFSDADSAALLNKESRAQLLLLTDESAAAGSAAPTARIPVAGGGRTKQRRTSFLSAETVTQKFRTQLGSLMEAIEKTDVQYVRCIKPNANKSSTEYDAQMIVQQLRSAGMIEAIRISRAAYPYRITHSEFLSRFKCLRPLAWHLRRAAEFDTLVNDTGDSTPFNSPDRTHMRAAAGALIIDVLKKSPVPIPQDKVAAAAVAKSSDGGQGGYMAKKRAQEAKEKELQQQQKAQAQGSAAVATAAAAADEKKNWELGRTRVYFSAGVLEHLEGLRANLIHERLVLIQSAYRGYRARSLYHRLRQGAIRVQSKFRGYRQKCSYLVMLSMVHVLQRVCRLFVTRLHRQRRRLHRAAACIQSTWRACGPKRAYVTFRSAVVLLQSVARMRRQHHRYIIRRDAAREQASMQGRMEAMQAQMEQEAEERLALHAALEQKTREEEAEKARLIAVAAKTEQEAKADAVRLEEALEEIRTLKLDNAALSLQVEELSSALEIQKQQQISAGSTRENTSHVSTDESLRQAFGAVEADRDSILRAAQDEADALLEQARVQAAAILKQKQHPTESSSGEEKSDLALSSASKMIAASSSRMRSRSDLLSNRVVLQETSQSDRVHVQAMLAAMETGSGVRCAVYAVERRNGQLVGKPCVLKKAKDISYVGHTRIDCEVHTPVAAEAMPPVPPGQRSPESECEELPPFPSEVLTGSLDTPSSASSSNATAQVKTLRFAVGDVQHVRTGNCGLINLPKSINDEKILVLTVKGKGELHFVMASALACKRVSLLFHELLAHPSSRTAPSPKAARTKSTSHHSERALRNSRSSMVSVSLSSPAPMSNPRVSSSNSENRRNHQQRNSPGSSSTLPSPPALPFGSSMLTPLDKKKSRSGVDVEGSGKGNSGLSTRTGLSSSPSGGGGGSPGGVEKRYKAGWTWKDEGARRLTRQFMVLDKESRELRFACSESSPESPASMSPSKYGSTIDLVPGRTKVLKTTSTAFGKTVSMLEIHSDDALMARLQVEMKDVSGWFRALRDALVH